MTDQLNREGVKAIAHALQDRDEAAAAAGRKPTMPETAAATHNETCSDCELNHEYYEVDLCPLHRAAPALLAAARMLVAWDRAEIEHESDEIVDVLGLVEARDALNAAIAKATS